MRGANHNLFFFKKKIAAIFYLFLVITKPFYVHIFSLKEDLAEDDEPACTRLPSGHDILNCLDHLRNWVVVGGGNDLRNVHEAISTIQSFCMKNFIPPPPLPANKQQTCSRNQVNSSPKRQFHQNETRESMSTRCRQIQQQSNLPSFPATQICNNSASNVNSMSGSMVNTSTINIPVTHVTHPNQQNSYNAILPANFSNDGTPARLQPQLNSINYVIPPTGHQHNSLSMPVLTMSGAIIGHQNQHLSHHAC